MVTNAQLPRMYRKYNRLYFSGKLPVNLEVAFETEGKNLRGWGVTDYICDSHGCYHPTKILINRSLKVCRGWASMTLLHEMVHVELPYGASHGPRFQARMRKLASQGAFDRWW